MVSHQHKCIFIHIPKTAGTSIEYKLGFDATRKRNMQDHRAIRMFEPCYLAQTVRTALHGDITPLRKYVRHWAKGRHFVSQQQYQTYFKFAFVRNPWARVHSWYKNLMRDPILKQTFTIDDSCTFEQYVHERLGTWWLQPQMYWITDSRGQVALDFVGRYEQLSDDFAKVCRMIGLPNAELPKVNLGTRSDYRPHYSDETRAIVAQHYAEEIERFNFVFGEPS